MFLNRLELIGFAGVDAEVSYTSNGTPYAVLSVATKTSWKDSKGEWQDVTEWHKCVVWGEDFVVHAATFTKGTHVYVAGELRSRDYTKDGVPHRVWECRADTLRRLDRAAQSDGAPTPDATVASETASTEVPL